MRNELYKEATTLLKQLIAIPSFSREEQGTAAFLETYLQQKGVHARRMMNNVWAGSKYFDKKKRTILLNSHHDTVKPNQGYTRDPFAPTEEDRKIYGLGSNDAGGCLVSLLTVFLHYYERSDLKYNLVFAATAEEEVSGANGIEALLPLLGNIDVAIVGEPTKMQMAVAERGLLVLDCEARGKGGHAAREEGDNAIYKALEDIRWFSAYRFSRISDTLGPVKMSVTVINGGMQHNVVPAVCSFTVDIRLNDCYTHNEVLAVINEYVSCEVVPRSKRLRSSVISTDHELVKAGVRNGCSLFGSPTMSDMALIPFPAVKIGPGDSARSHTADEYIYIDEIENGIEGYIKILDEVL